MWAIRGEGLDGEGDWGLRYEVEQDGHPASVGAVLLAWRDDPAFRSAFVAALADAPFPAFRWETPPVTAATADRPFEFVLLDSPELARQADPSAFAPHFSCAEDAEVLTFANLGGDATLLVPCPLAAAGSAAYGHLAAFVRLAPEGQRHALWRAVAEAMFDRVGDRPVWLSTAGAGVPWLHVRLDDRPKYYSYAPYRVPD